MIKTLNLIVFIFCALTAFNQKVYQILRVSHNTKNYYLFSKETNNLVFGLQQNSKNLSAKKSLSNSSKLTDSSFNKFFKEFHQYVPRDFFDEGVMTNDTLIQTLDGTQIWTETTLYSIDLKTKKVEQYIQIKIFFNGKDPEIEMVSPKIDDIKILSGKDAVNRTSMIVKQKHRKSSFTDDPSPIQHR